MSRPEIVRVFIGYDRAEAVAYHVLTHSILTHTDRPVSVAPVALHQLRAVHGRERDPRASTDFSITRFLVPWLCNYEGWAIFLDCDMLLRADIGELWDYRSMDHAVHVVKHDHRPRETTKFLGRTQSAYPRKNWSSVMLYNCTLCENLTPRYVETAAGVDLHRFMWLEDDALIGELPREWNHLVGYDDPDLGAKIVHYTLGGPYFEASRGCEYAREWFREFREAAHAERASFQIIV